MWEVGIGKVCLGELPNWPRWSPRWAGARSAWDNKRLAEAATLMVANTA